jgi:hypothetical protein
MITEASFVRPARVVVLNPEAVVDDECPVVFSYGQFDSNFTAGGQKQLVSLEVIPE